MDESTFQRELNKYKIVRPSDYHKSRTSKSRYETKSRLTNTPATIPSSSSLKAAVPQEGDFPELLSAATASLLTPDELRSLLGAISEVKTFMLFVCCPGINHILRNYRK